MIDVLPSRNTWLCCIFSTTAHKPNAVLLSYVRNVLSSPLASYSRPSSLDSAYLTHIALDHGLLTFLPCGILYFRSRDIRCYGNLQLGSWVRPSQSRWQRRPACHRHKRKVSESYNRRKHWRQNRSQSEQQDPKRNDFDSFPWAISDKQQQPRRPSRY
jgi:hypothetical protein